MCPCDAVSEHVGYICGLTYFLWVIYPNVSRKCFTRMFHENVSRQNMGAFAPFHCYSASALKPLSLLPKHILWWPGFRCL